MRSNVEPLEPDGFSQISTSKDSLSQSSVNINITPEEPLRTMIVERKMSICVTCGEDFMSTSNLYQHMKIHSSEKSLVCDTC